MVAILSRGRLVNIGYGYGLPPGHYFNQFLINP